MRVCACIFTHNMRIDENVLLLIFPLSLADIKMGEAEGEREREREGEGAFHHITIHGITQYFLLARAT
jgi:hypothetical protein